MSEGERKTGNGIRLLAMGGTISMSLGTKRTKPAMSAAELSRPFREVSSSVDVAFVNGSEIEFAVLHRLVSEIDKAVMAGVDGVVVTLGTDAIEEAAAWIACSGPWGIPIVITGSIFPGKRIGSDGMANLSDSIAVALDSAVSEPVVVFGGRIFAAHEVTNVSGLERVAFESPNFGPVGTVLAHGPSWHRRLSPWKFTLGRPGSDFPVVPIIVASLGDDGSLIGFAARISDIIVIAGNGAGNLPPAQARAAIYAASQGKLVVVVSRATDSRVGPIHGYPGGSAALANHGVIVVSGLTPHRARIVLCVGSSQGRSLESLAEVLKGDFTERAGDGMVNDQIPQDGPKTSVVGPSRKRGVSTAFKRAK